MRRMTFRFLSALVLVVTCLSVLMFNRISHIRNQEEMMKEFPGKTPRAFYPEVGDVMVHIAIPHTASHTLLKGLLSLDTPSPCICTCPRSKCPCHCPPTEGSTDNWLYSWRTTPFYNDTNVRLGFSELKNYSGIKQLQNTGHRVFYVTMLRDPVKRLVGDWFQTYNTGFVWTTKGLNCTGGVPVSESMFCRREASEYEMFVNTKSLSAVDAMISLKRVSRLPVSWYLECIKNHAINRQVTLLADPDACALYDGYQAWQDAHLTEERFREEKERWEQAVRSAAGNLLKLDYFGLAEYQELSQELLEWTINVELKHKAKQSKLATADLILRNFDRVKEKELEMLKVILEPEIAFYNYAKEIFFKRVSVMKAYKGI